MPSGPGSYDGALEYLMVERGEARAELVRIFGERTIKQLERNTNVKKSMYEDIPILEYTGPVSAKEAHRRWGHPSMGGSTDPEFDFSGGGL